MKIIIATLLISLNSGLIAGQDKLPVLAHWSFDKDSGKTLLDSGSGKFNATLISKDKSAEVVTEKGIKGKALKLAARPLVQFVVNDSRNELNLTPPFTISMWIKRTGLMPKSMCLLSKRMDKDKKGWDLKYNWSMISMRFGDGQKRQSISTPRYQIKNNKWYHIAVTDDGKKVQLYVNCEKVAERDFENSTPVPNKIDVVIGNYPGKNSAYNFIGLIDEIYIVKKVMSGEELFRQAAF